MNESQLISELCAALDDAAATVRAPAGAARRVRGRVRRHRLARGLAAGVPAAGVAAGLAVALGGPRAPGRPQVPGAQATARAHQPDIMTVGYVTDRAKAALSKVSGSIIETTGHGFREWENVATGAGRKEDFGPGGKLVSDDLSAVSGGAEHRIYVDYAARTWWQLTSKDSAAGKKRDPSGILPVSGNSASGQVTVLGHRTLDGRDTILVKYGPPRGFKPTASEEWPTELVWLDAATYLPVHTKISGIGPVEEQSLAYLPGTQANLAKFTLTPPAGFRKVTPPPFRGDGRPGLGDLP